MNELGRTSCIMMGKIYAHALWFETFRERDNLRET